jgi:hypothetical protein
MSKDIKKSFARLSELAAEIRKGEIKDGARDGHATIGNNLQDTKAHQVAKPAAMPIAKSQIPSPKHGIPAPSHTIPVKHIKSPSREKTYLKVQKGIVLMQKELDPNSYKPITDDMIKKSFGGEIPSMMSSSSNRPSIAWWNRGMEKVQNIVDQPENFLQNVWYGDIQKETPWAKESYSEPKELNRGDISEESVDEDGESLKKWLPAALEGGGFKTLREHPRAGKAISKASSSIGNSVMGRSSLGDIDPEALGYAIIEAIDEIVNGTEDEKLAKAWSSALSGLLTPASKVHKDFDPLTQKSVAEPLSSKFQPKKRESKLGADYDGESAIGGDPTKANVKDLADKSNTMKDLGD